MSKNINKKSKLIENLKNTYCKLKPSAKNGVGVFAIIDIQKGTNLFKGINQQKWYKINSSELKDFDREILKMISDFFVIEKKGEVQIPEYGLNGMDISFFLNHSKNPNAKTTDDGNTFITLRKIKKGEEITVNYGTYDNTVNTTKYK